MDSGAGSEVECIAYLDPATFDVTTTFGRVLRYDPQIVNFTDSYAAPAVEEEKP